MINRRTLPFGRLIGGNFILLRGDLRRSHSRRRSLRAHRRNIIPPIESLPRSFISGGHIIQLFFGILFRAILASRQGIRTR